MNPAGMIRSGVPRMVIGGPRPVMLGSNPSALPVLPASVMDGTGKGSPLEAELLLPPPQEGIKEEVKDLKDLIRMDSGRSASPIKDELTDILSDHINLDTMVTESGLPNMDCKARRSIRIQLPNPADMLRPRRMRCILTNPWINSEILLWPLQDVEDIFKGVLTDESQESADSTYPSITATPSPAAPPLLLTSVKPSYVTQQQQQQQQQPQQPQQQSSVILFRSLASMIRGCMPVISILILVSC